MSELKIKLKGNEFLGDHFTQIIDFIDKNDKVLLHSNPATGKTRLFADLAIKLKSSNSKNRIVFLTPFLIIQHQLKTYLSENGFALDFILNGDTEDKSLKDSYTIISSTYHSLYHILDDLNESDYIVVDEAHALLYNYKETKSKRFYFSDVITHLYCTQAKVVLMTGTPQSGLTEIFDLETIKVSKENALKSIINVCYSTNNPFDIAMAFIEKVAYSDSYDPKSLHIIYLKNTSECEKLAFAIETKGYKSKALTANHKKEDTYQSIVNNMTIPDDIQFLFTTNVISTGANINNTNIGSALMIDEFSPLEIKQFSKRFRNKLNIEVDVVNRIHYGRVFNDDLTTIAEINKERKKQRKYFNAILKELKRIKSNNRYSIDFKHSFEYDYTGTPKHLIQVIIERFVKQESYFNDLLISENVNSEDLVEQLSVYSDLTISEDTSYSEYEVIDNTALREIVDKEFENKKTEVLLDFIKREPYYLKAIRDYVCSKDVMLRYKFDAYFNYENSIEVPDKIKENVTSFSFVKRIVEPLFDYSKHFNSASETIHFIHNFPKNKRNKHLISLEINRLLLTYFELSKNPFSDSNIRKKTSIDFSALNKEILHTLNIIESAYNFLFPLEYFHYNELENHLKNDSNLRGFFNYKGQYTFFPIKHSKLIVTRQKMEKSLIIGIASGIFLIKSSLSDRKDHKGSKRKAYIFETNLPVKYNVTSNTLNKDYSNITKNTDIRQYTKMKVKGQKYKFSTPDKIICNRALLNYVVLGAKYYNIKQ